MSFEGKNIVITGASSGIGKAAAIKFAKKGAKIALVARRQKKLEQVEDELKSLGAATLVCRCDISDKLQVKAMHKAVLERFGPADVLVNNAGFAIYGSVSELTIDEIESQMNTNYLGMVYCTKNFLPDMLKNGSGHIVNVASVAASFGLPGIASYCASKFAMLGFSEGLLHELKGTGVGITVVSPIMVRTDFFDHPSFTGMPRSSMSISAETVAGVVLRAARSHRLEIIVPQIIRGAVWTKHTLPFLINPIVGSVFQRQLDAASKE